MGLLVGVGYLSIHFFSLPNSPKQAPALVKVKDLLAHPGSYHRKYVILSDGNAVDPVFVFGRCLFLIQGPQKEESIKVVSHRMWDAQTPTSSGVFFFEVAYSDASSRLLILREVKYPM